MRAYVLPDPRLVKLAGRFVWLGIDTENPKNLHFTEKFPIDAWPSLLVVDPATEQVVVRWAGTATAAEIEKLAIDGERALKSQAASRADGYLAEADKLLGARAHAKAAEAYGKAVAEGGKAWPGYERAAEARVSSLALADDAAGCAAAARELSPAIRGAPSAARVLAQGLGCALSLDGEDAKKAAVAPLVERAKKLLGDPAVLADDRSWLYDELVQVKRGQGDEAGAKALAGRWLQFLEREVKRAKGPMERSAFNGQLVSAALAVGQPERVLPTLVQSEKDLPGDFAPPTLVGYVSLKLGKNAEALAAADRALALAQGPRRIRILVLKGQAEQALGQPDVARATFERALAEGEALPDNARPTGFMRQARKALDGLKPAGS
ncbi:MAG: hypothetical protein QM704_07990 [Anaeromyxobacteraceae bacterium]